MGPENVLLFKILYVLALAVAGLALALLVQHGIDAQVEALPYYADVWAG